MIHPHTELKFINDEIGYGIVATHFIPRGTVTWVMDKLDNVFTLDEMDRMEPVYKDILDKYTFRDNTGNYVLCWDLARYVNHSFNPNCLTTPYDFELAIRDIRPGEELTNDYGTLNITEPFYCVPEEGVSRRVVMPDDLIHFHANWDEKLISTIKYFTKVEQPLCHIFTQNLLRKVTSIAQGHQPMASILLCYCGPCQESFVELGCQ